MSSYIGLFETCESSSNFEYLYGGWFGQASQPFYLLQPALASVFVLTVRSSRQMTTACEEKSAANFAREVGEQPSVS